MNEWDDPPSRPLRHWLWLGASAPAIGYLLVFLPIAIRDIFPEGPRSGWEGIGAFFAFLATLVPWLAWAILGTVFARVKSGRPAAGQFFLGAFLVPVVVGFLLLALCSIA